MFSKSVDLPGKAALRRGIDVLRNDVISASNDIIFYLYPNLGAVRATTEDKRAVNIEKLRLIA